MVTIREIGIRLRRRRKLLRIGMPRMSAECFMSIGHIHHIETNKVKDIGILTLQRMAKYLGTTVEELLAEEPGTVSKVNHP